MKKAFIAVDQFFHYDRVKKWLMTILLIGSCIVVYEIVRIGDNVADTLKAVKKQAESQTYADDLKSFTDEARAHAQINLIKIDGIVDNLAALVSTTKDDLHDNLVSLNNATGQVGGLVADMRTNTRPRIDGLIDTVNSSAQQFSEDLHSQQERVSKLFDDNAPNVRRATDSLAHATEKIDAYVSDPKIAQFIDDELAAGKQITVKLNTIAGNVEVMTSDGKTITANAAAIATNLKTISDDSAKEIHSLLNPPPAPFWKRYILYPLKDAAGVTYLLVRIANGL